MKRMARTNVSLIATIAIVAVVAIAGATYQKWFPLIWPRIEAILQRKTDDDAGGGEHGEHGHSHDHEGHSHRKADPNVLELSTQAQGNIGLTEEYLKPVELETFRIQMTVPGIVEERPGRTRIEVSTPMAGVITRVYAVEGESVHAGTKLFELRITAEELVDSQTEFLRIVGELDVENKEIKRLSEIAKSGAIAPKALLERQYAKDKLENLLRAQREALRLHGLSDRQIDQISTERKLFRDLQIFVPSGDGTAGEIQLARKGDVVLASTVEEESPNAEAKDKTPLIVTRVPVRAGQTVMAGTTLAEIVDYSELYIEGRTFEREARALADLKKSGWTITAVSESAADKRETVTGLEYVYSGAEIDPESRTFSFYVRLPNEVVRNVPSPNGQTFVEWRHRPGSRVQLLVPIEELKDQIVLPVEAVAREGAESFVFQQNGNSFVRIPVRVSHRDSTHVVIANDGSIFPGDVIARTGAHQMQMALKNKSGAGVDPHAGHNH